MHRNVEGVMADHMCEDCGPDWDKCRVLATAGRCRRVSVSVSDESAATVEYRSGDDSKQRGTTSGPGQHHAASASACAR